MERLGSLLSVGHTWLANTSHPNNTGDLIITTVHNPPFVLVQRQEDGSYRYDGYLVHLWRIIAGELGLRYRIEPLLSGAYGSVDENGTWSGMIGELAYGRADVAMTALYLRLDRAAVVDYLDSVAVARSFSTFYVRAGREEGITPLTVDMFRSLLQPLHVGVWWAVLASVLVLSVVLRISLRFGGAGNVQHIRETKDDTPPPVIQGILRKHIPHLEVEDGGRQEEDAPRPAEQMGLGTCLLFCFTSFVGQSWPELPSGASARIITTCCWMLRTIVYTSYTANLISHMVVSKVDLPISSLQEFAELPGWRLAIQPGHAILNDWKRSADQYEQELYRRSVTKQGFIEINFRGDSIFEVVQPKVMTFVNFDKVVYALGPEVCHLMAVPGLPVKSKDVFMAISKRRPELRQNINEVLLKLKETGMLSELRGGWIKSKDEMCRASSEYRQMSLGDMLVILIIVPVSVAMCVAVCAAEWMWLRLSRSGNSIFTMDKMLCSMFNLHRHR